MTLKLITIDLDGTLLRSDRTFDQERFHRVRQALEAQGIMVSVLTGNTQAKVFDYFPPTDCQGIYFACDNGNFLFKDDETLRKIGIPYADCMEIIDFLSEFPEYHPILCTGEVSYSAISPGPIRDFVCQFNNDLIEISDYRQIPQDSAVTKIAIANQEGLDQNKVLVRIINEKYDQVTAVTSGEGWVDIYQKAGGKGSAVAYLKARYGFESQDCLAIGDSLNDESMMAEVYYSVAMANADKDLAMQCRYQIGHNDDQAVISLLEQINQDPSLEFMQAYRTIKE